MGWRERDVGHRVFGAVQGPQGGVDVVEERQAQEEDEPGRVVLADGAEEDVHDGCAAAR